MISTNWTLTLYDLVGHAIPGIFGVMLFKWLFPMNVPPGMDNPLYIFVTGFIFGYLLHAFGTALYHGWYKENYLGKSKTERLIGTIDKIVIRFQIFKVNSTSPDIKHQLWKTINQKLGYRPEKETSLLLFQIADTVAARSKFDERSLLLAKEAFYRSLTALTVVTLPFLIWKFWDYWFAISLVGLLLIELFRYQREYFRRIKNNQVYVLALMELKSG